MRRPVQTNEVGRSRALALGFLRLASETGLAAAAARARLERGAQSALGRLPLRAPAGSSSAMPRSPVQFLDYAEGALPSLPGHVGIVERSGCDEAPVALDDDGRAHAALVPVAGPAGPAARCSTARSRWPPGSRSRWSARARRTGSSAGWPSPCRARARSSSTRSSCSTWTPAERERIGELIAAAGARATERGPARAAGARAGRRAGRAAPDRVARRRGARAGARRLPRRAGALGGRLRAAGPADAQAVAELIARCDASYGEWAPDGWSPPPPDEPLARERLGDPSAWSRVAVEGEQVVGVVVWRPLTAGALLSWLFTDPGEWGSGLAQSPARRCDRRDARGGARRGRAVGPRRERPRPEVLRAQRLDADGRGEGA